MTGYVRGWWFGAVGKLVCGPWIIFSSVLLLLFDIRVTKLFGYVEVWRQYGILMAVCMRVLLLPCVLLIRLRSALDMDFVVRMVENGWID